MDKINPIHLETQSHDHNNNHDALSQTAYETLLPADSLPITLKAKKGSPAS